MTTGARRTPWLTTLVLVLTAVPNVISVLDPSVLHALERTPAGLHGEWWRWLTSLVVQDGGAVGTVFNLAFLAAAGFLAEQTLTRPRWLAAYLLTGLAGEAFGYAWQPVGGGNSVAVCGLVAVVAAALVTKDSRLPRWAPVPGLLWTGALLLPCSALYLVAAVALAVLCTRVPAVRTHAGAVHLVAVAAGGVVLAAQQDIHGGALLVGLGLAAIVRFTQR